MAEQKQKFDRLNSHSLMSLSRSDKSGNVARTLSLTKYDLRITTDTGEVKEFPNRYSLTIAKPTWSAEFKQNVIKNISLELTEEDMPELYTTIQAILGKQSKAQ